MFGNAAPNFPRQLYFLSVCGWERKPGYIFLGKTPVRALIPPTVSELGLVGHVGIKEVLTSRDGKSKITIASHSHVVYEMARI